VKNDELLPALPPGLFTLHSYLGQLSVSFNLVISFCIDKNNIAHAFISFVLDRLVISDKIFTSSKNTMSQEETEPATSSLASLPSEVLVTVFGHLDWDSLQAVEAVSDHFRSVVRSSVLIWSGKVDHFLQRKGLQLECPPVLRRIRRRPAALRRFYQCLRQLENNILEGNFAKRWVRVTPER
jgi:hypothetical protein